MTAAHWGLLAVFAAFAVLVVLLRWRWPRLRASDAEDSDRMAREMRQWADELPPHPHLLPVPVGQTDPRVADLEHMTDDEIARFIADCAEAAAVIERQWTAANAELAERHRAMRRTEDT